MHLVKCHLSRCRVKNFKSCFLTDKSFICDKFWTIVFLLNSMSTTIFVRIVNHPLAIFFFSFFFFLSSSYSILFSGCILILNVVSISLLITCFQSFGTREASWLVDLLHPTRNKTLRMRNFLTKLQSLPHQVNGNPNKCYENATNSNHGKHPGIQMFIFWGKNVRNNDLFSKNIFWVSFLCFGCFKMCLLIFNVDTGLEFSDLNASTSSQPDWS